MAPPRAEAQRPLLLAIDTSTDQAGLALYDGDIVSEVTWPASRTARQTVLPEILHLLERANRSLDAVAAVGVALGPGSFSALRTGVSLAKGLVYARRCPLIGISTLDVVSYPHRQVGLAVWAIVQAGRGQVVGACYAPDSESGHVDIPLYHGSLDGLVDLIAGPAVVTGEVSRAMIEALAHDAAIIVPPAALRQRRAGVLAELAWLRWRAGLADDPFVLEPLYLHGDGGGDRGVRA